jgi:hypothetical protein
MARRKQGQVPPQSPADDDHLAVIRPSPNLADATLLREIEEAGQIQRRDAINRETQQANRAHWIHGIQQKAWLALMALVILSLISADIWSVAILFVTDGSPEEHEYAFRFLEISADAFVAGFIAFLAIRSFEPK